MPDKRLDVLGIHVASEVTEDTMQTTAQFTPDSLVRVAEALKNAGSHCNSAGLAAEMARGLSVNAAANRRWPVYRLTILCESTALNVLRKHIFNELRSIGLDASQVVITPSENSGYATVMVILRCREDRQAQLETLIDALCTRSEVRRASWRRQGATQCSTQPNSEALV